MNAQEILSKVKIQYDMSCKFGMVGNDKMGGGLWYRRGEGKGGGGVTNNNKMFKVGGGAAKDVQKVIALRVMFFWK